MMMVKVIARTVGLYQLILSDFYSYLERYVQPHQEYITTVLEAAVQACHEMVPPAAVEALFKIIVNRLVHDRSPPEDITVGLNVVREICLCMPLLMTEELLQDLVSYRKLNEKAVSSASHSLLTLFREICPSLLTRKDRGRPAEVKAKPKAFGEVHVSSYDPFAELLEQGVQGSIEEEDIAGKTCDLSVVHSSQEYDYAHLVEEDGSDEKHEVSGVVKISDLADGATEMLDNEEECEDNADDESSLLQISIGFDTDIGNSISKEKKRKFSDFEGQQLNASDKSVRALKKSSGTTTKNSSSSTHDGILSNEDYNMIAELKAEKDARTALSQHGVKLPSSEQLRTKKVDAATLEAHIKRKLSKEEKLALIRRAREERGKYQGRATIK